MGLKEATEYTSELKKAEKSRDIKDQRNYSSQPGQRRSGSGTSMASVRSGSGMSNELATPGVDSR